MNENTDTNDHLLTKLYLLEVRLPDQATRKIEVIDQVQLGLDPRNDLILIGPKIKAKHFDLQFKNDLLTLHYLGNSGDSFLNNLPLEKDKNYILEKGDILTVEKIKITIHLIAVNVSSNKMRITRPTKLPPLPTNDFIKEHIKTDNTPSNSTPLNLKKTKKKDVPFFDFTTIKFIPYKFFGFILDIAFTYLVLAFIIPSLGVLEFTQEWLYPITKASAHWLIPYQGFKILSLIEFAVCFHSLMIVMSLILGTTPGAFLIGLHPQNKSNSFLAPRFKAYLYALLNIIALPLILFDIPFYRGLNLKEILTFSKKRELNQSSFFKILRRAFAPIFIFASFLSPFFLKPNYTSPITKELSHSAKYKDPHTTSISTSSSELGISLKTDINNQYALLPYFKKNKIGIVFYDLNNNQAISMQEESRTSSTEALFKLRYANPLASLTIPNQSIEAQKLKHKSNSSLELSLTHLPALANEFGLFSANGFLFREMFLKKFTNYEQLLLNTFNDQNPMLKISSLISNEQKVFLFTNKDIIQFSLSKSLNLKMSDYFTNEILTGFSFDQSAIRGQKDPQLLEVLDAFVLEKYHPLLTYYINEAKKVHKLKNPLWREFFINNLVQTKEALLDNKEKAAVNRNIIRSLDEIIRTL